MPNKSNSLYLLYLMFFISGCAAIIYQLMWQRILFTLFGVDLVSVTIIVSVFMFGLGVGGLYGGYLADKWPNQLLRFYVGIEVSIAIFGFKSPALLSALGNFFFTDSKLLTLIAVFLILAFPTLLMGATFPILVTYVNNYTQNVGQSVGNLYFINTLGSSFGAFLAGFLLLYYFELSGSIYCAVFLNGLVAFLAVFLWREKKCGS